MWVAQHIFCLQNQIILRKITSLGELLNENSYNFLYSQTCKTSKELHIKVVDWIGIFASRWLPIFATFFFGCIVKWHHEMEVQAIYL